MAEAIALTALLTAIAACIYAHRAYVYARASRQLQEKVVAIMESRSSRTVVCDLGDGRITVIKELKDAT